MVFIHSPSMVVAFHELKPLQAQTITFSHQECFGLAVSLHDAGYEFPGTGI
jgi:hypothetical protein